MFCGNCGNQVADGSDFCPYCGGALKGTPAGKGARAGGIIRKLGVNYNNARNMGDDEEYAAEYGEEYTAPGTSGSDSKSKSKIAKKVFVEPDEEYIAALGDGYLNSFLTRKDIKRCIALLSDKRVYLRGNLIDINSGKFARINMQKTVDLEDVTGTGFIYVSPKIWQFIAGVIAVGIGVIGFIYLTFDSSVGEGLGASFPFLIIGTLFLLYYFKYRKTNFFIEYAGGSIRFDASIYALAESRDFEKQIRRAKNKVKEDLRGDMHEVWKDVD